MENNVNHKLKLLMWKCWKTTTRDKCGLVWEFGLPFGMCAMIIFMQQTLKIKEHKPIHFEPYDPLTYLPPPDKNNLAYAPCNSKIGAVLDKIENVNVSCFDTELELEESISNDETYFAGIQFDDKYFISTNEPFDNELSITFRFPTFYTKDDNITKWSTSKVFPDLQVPGPRNPNKQHTHSPNYRDTYFLALQVKFAKAFAETTLNATVPKILLQKYPHSEWVEDKFHSEESIIAIVMLFGAMFYHTSTGLGVAITTEKENQLKESMKIMGLPGWMHWLGWFLKTFLAGLIIVGLLTLILTSLSVNSQPSVLKYSGIATVLALFILYLISLIFFTFLISTFFSKGSTMSVFGALIFMLGLLPFFLVHNSGSRSVKIACSLFSNTAYLFGVKTLLHYEAVKEHVDWNKVVKSNDLTMLAVVIILLIDSVIYLLLALYMEAIFPGDFGMPQKWYFPFTSSYWCGEQEYATDDVTESKNENEFIEEAPENLRAGIQLRNLSKNFGVNKVVKKLNLDIYDGQITILLGHNGAGKTTTMSMITGMFPPTSGTAIVGGYDVRTNVDQVRHSLGLCLQHNVLFDNLTVEEHIHFFGRLKGLTIDEIEHETDLYLKILQFEDKRKSYCSTLSGGMKRKLCVAISLCGNSKIVILDEPTAGMDPAARRTVWELLQKQKKGRTILLTTHYMDEADLLGDRIAIMCDGQVKCVGTSFFLKKKYGSGYYLVMEAQADCDENEVTDMLRRHISSVKLNSHIGSELSYLLLERELGKFEGTLSDLEKNFKRLKINGYGLSLANMEEVFMKVGADQKPNNKPETKITLEETLKTKFNTGVCLMCNHCEAMTIKIYKSILRKWILFLFQLFIPVIIIILILTLTDTTPTKSFPALPLMLKSYSNATTLLNGNSSNDYYNLYKQLLSGNHIREDSNIEDVMLSVTNKTPNIAKTSYIVGATFNETNIIAWFNGDPYHAEPLSLQLVLNAILRKTNNKTYIKITNHPFDLSAKATEKHMKSQQSSLVGVLGFILGFLSGFFAMFHIKDRITRSKHLQFVSGVNIALYWGLAYLWDIAIFLLSMLLIILVLGIFKPDGFRTFEEIGRLFLLLICFGLSFLPLVYLISMFAKNEALGFSITLMIFLFSMIGGNMVESLNDKDTKKLVKQILLIVPFFNIDNGLKKLYITHAINKASKTEIDFLNNEHFGIGLNLLMLLAALLLCFVLLLLCEIKLKDKILKKFLKKNPPIFKDLEEDVVKENQTIRTTSKRVLNENYRLVLLDVTKYYGKFLAVNKLCLGVKAYECFGLLGVNGAGKTTTFQMMTGDEAMTSGEAWINGFSVNKQLRKVHKSLGYCPQFDALLPDLTARETLLIYALIRGVPYKDCHKLGENLAIEFDFFQHLDKRTKRLSGGNKRKLSTALALIGDPTIVFLDEPTAGMDPATRRFLWQVLCKVRDNGKTIILTSHSMEECEALCTRLAIMVNGKFECIGSSQRLKNKFAQGTTLTIKLKKHKKPGKVEKETEEVEKFVKYQFSGATLQEKHEELMTFLIPSTSIPCSAIFGILEQNKSHLNIEDYAVGQSSLEQVFLSFTKTQI